MTRCRDPALFVRRSGAPWDEVSGARWDRALIGTRPLAATLNTQGGSGRAPARLFLLGPWAMMFLIGFQFAALEKKKTNPQEHGF